MSDTPPFYCIAHQAPGWPLPDFMTVIGTGDYVPPRGIAMSQSFPKEAHKNRYLGEYVALYEIRRMLLASGADGFVGLCHYRRYALPNPPGEMRGFNYLAHPDLLAGLRPEDYFGDGQTPIVPLSVAFPGSVLQQAAASDIGRDLLMYFGDAIDCGIITDQEASWFLSGNRFITAPTVAFIPVEWFVEIVDALERVNSRFFRHHYIERAGHFSRTPAFCCERLQALLLAKRIAAWGKDKVIERALTLFDASGSRQPPTIEQA